MLGQNANVILKRKNIQVVVDYCLDNRIETKMTPRDMPEEWELEFNVVDIMKAISLGMFLRDNKIDLAGMFQPSTIKNSVAPTAIKASRNAKKKVETTINDKDNADVNAFLNSEGIFKTTPANTENIFNMAPVSATIANDDELPL